jgi:hypothetical protein
MQTVREQKIIDVSAAGFRTSPSQSPVSNQENTLKIREFISWSVCFAVVAGLTGLLMYLNVGVTMESVTSILFYSSLAGLIYFVSKIILTSRKPVHMNTRTLHELN